MHKYRILVIGGYGFFGRRLVKRLTRNPQLHIVVSGRSGPSGKALVAELSSSA